MARSNQPAQIGGLASSADSDGGIVNLAGLAAIALVDLAAADHGGTRTGTAD